MMMRVPTESSAPRCGGFPSHAGIASFAHVNTTVSGRRAGTASPLRRAAQYALAVGIVLAIASAFGSVWVARLGILSAIVGGLLALRFAWREVAEARAEHAQAMTHTARAQGQALAMERRRTGEVLETLRGHNASADASVRRLESTIGELRGEINTLRGANAGMQVELIERDHRIKRLTADLATREAELRVLQQVEDDAEVLAMPRHAAGASDWDALPTAEEIFGGDDHPTVVDLQKIAFPAATAEQRKQA